MAYLQQLVMVDKEESIKSVDFDWRNPYSASKLSRAVRSNNLRMVKKLLKGGSAIDAPDNRGWTPLHEAATSDDLAEIAEVLIHAGAYIEHKTVDGETPLLIACKNQAEKVVKALVDAGCIVNTRNNEYFTPLHVACSQRNEDIVRLLVSEGADPEAKDDEERTPLYLALENVNPGALKIMIEAGADLKTNDFFSRTPLQYSCMVGNMEIFNILIDHLGSEKSIIDQQTPEGWTLLMEAAQYKNYMIAEKLIEYGTDTTLVDNRDLLALHIAAHCERYNLLELLLKHTPKETIETYSTVGKDMTHSRSLPCLIIDKNVFDGLELLYESGLSEDVLKCPVQMGTHLLSPISFLLLHAASVDDSSKVDFLNFLLKFDFLLDPIYKLEDSYTGDYLLANDIKVVSPIEAAITMHRKNHVDCCCATFLSMILERGVSPDTLPANLSTLPNNNLYLFRKAVQYDFYAGLDLLLKYSDKSEPIDILEMIITGIINSNILAGNEMSMVTFLVGKCTHEISRLFSVLQQVRLDMNYGGGEARLARLEEVLASQPRVPTLKWLSRSAVRRHIHDVSSSPASKLSFREHLRLLDLPSYISRYLLYQVDF